MLNKTTGWLIFIQLGYVTLFIALSVINYATDGEIVCLLEKIREPLGISNHRVRLNEYVSYPLAFSSPINIVLALVFFAKLLRKNGAMDFSKDFFNIINAVYVASSCWFFMSVLCNIMN